MATMAQHGIANAIVLQIFGGAEQLGTFLNIIHQKRVYGFCGRILQVVHEDGSH